MLNGNDHLIIAFALLLVSQLFDNRCHATVTDNSNCDQQLLQHQTLMNKAAINSHHHQVSAHQLQLRHYLKVNSVFLQMLQNVLSAKEFTTLLLIINCTRRIRRKVNIFEDAGLSCCNQVQCYQTHAQQLERLSAKASKEKTPSAPLYIPSMSHQRQWRATAIHIIVEHTVHELNVVTNS